jgi:SynChlorMet cassette radical SAM/SPASM protein ScmF
MPCEEVGKTVVQETSPGEERLALPEGVPPLTSLYLYIAGSCNLACRHCWITPTYQTSSNNGKFIKLEHVEKAIREAKPLGLRSVKLTGGEPTLHPQFREIVRLISKFGLDIIIETNGTLIDADLADFLKQQRVCFISVSLDGATADVHDALRMVKGSYDQALTGIQALVQAGFRPQMICTLHRGNVSQIVDIVALANISGCGSVKFNHVQSVGRGERYAEEQGLKLAEIVQIYRHVDNELALNSKIPIYFDIPFAFYDIKKLLDSSLGRCTVLNILGMLSSGELSLCGIGEMISELVFGNIWTNDLADIWYHNPTLILLREQIPAQLEGVCKLCLHRDLCLGSCIAQTYKDTGRLNAAYNFCEHADSLGLFPTSRKKLIF